MHLRLYILYFITLLLTIPLLKGMDFKIVPFEQAVTIVAKACKSKNYTEQACCALLDIDKALRWNGPQEKLAIISKKTLKQDNAAYRQFNDLNLSGLITYYSTNFPQMKSEPFMKEEAPQLFQKVTKWQVFLGSLAQHNRSIVMEMSSPTFSQNSDSALRILAEQTLHSAEYFKHVANAKTGNESDIQAITAMLYFGEIALRENSRQKEKYEKDIQFEQPKIIEQAEQQNLQSEQKLPENPISNAPQNDLQEKTIPTIASKTADNVSHTTIEPIPSLKEQKSEQPQQKQTPPKQQIHTNQKKEAQLTPSFYQRPLLMSALVCCSAFLVWYFQEQIPTYLSYFYN